MPPLRVHEGTPGRSQFYALEGSPSPVPGAASLLVYCPSRKQLSASDAKVKRQLRARPMVVAKSQRGIKAGSAPQQNEVQWQRARAETLRTEERSVRMHKERLAP